MNKILKKTLSLALCFAIILSFSSCEYLKMLVELTPDEDIDAGITDNNNTGDASDNSDEGETDDVIIGCHCGQYKYYVFDTYEELIEAIEILKSNGVFIYPSVVFNCDGIAYNESTTADVKYSIYCSYYDHSCTEETEHYLDTIRESTVVVCHLFNYDFPTETGKLYGKNLDYDTCFRMYLGDTVESELYEGSFDLTFDNPELFTIDDGLNNYISESEEWPYEDMPNIYYIRYDGKLIATFHMNHDSSIIDPCDVPSCEFLVEFIKTLVIIK